MNDFALVLDKESTKSKSIACCSDMFGLIKSPSAYFLNVL